MTEVIGFSLDDAKKILDDSGIEYTVKETFSPKSLEDTDRVMVLRQRQVGDKTELVVGYFKTEL